MKTRLTISRDGTKITVRDEETRKKIIRVVDNENGFTVKSYAWTAANPDMYWNIPYDVASDLLDILPNFDFR